MNETSLANPSALQGAQAAASSVLGGMSPSVFLRDYWQKRPLLIRQALPGFKGIIQRDPFIALAEREDVTSRLVIQHPRRKKSQWERHDGPFGGIDTSMLPRSHWTLLIHGIESLVPGGWELLRRFSFIPSARIDDLMVSYASDGGTVGPHDDLYDVFLLQGPGKRRWQVSTQRDRTVDPDAAIKVLKSFVPEDEWLLEPGDMLYVPPGVAHYGVAEGPCFTYSIGFLAPSHRELVQGFVGYLGEVLTEELDAEARYADPDLQTQKEPLEVGDAMVDQIAAVLDRVRWDKRHTDDFLGRYLTGRQSPSTFAAPARALDESAFAQRLRGRGRLELALASRGLTRGNKLFLNGELHEVKPPTLRLFKQLVFDRVLPLPISADAQTLALFHDWYAAGYLRIV
ncbi:MAG TPA: cupin domain-containing protein [Pseudomonadota bacterium]|nr:cupin domain-containing protein [Pseudomonadota bacterium]